MSITKAELLMGRDKQYPQEYTRDISKNLDVLCEKLNVIREAYGQPMYVNSGWRTQGINDSTSNASKTSKHLVGLACDFKDVDGKLFKWCLANLKLIAELGLYLEDKRYTETWAHFQIGAPKSLKRIFIPSSKPAPAPHLWDGKYNTAEFDGPEKD